MNISLPVILRLGEESSMSPACGHAPGFFAEPANELTLSTRATKVHFRVPRKPLAGLVVALRMTNQEFIRRSAVLLDSRMAIQLESWIAAPSFLGLAMTMEGVI